MNLKKDAMFPISEAGKKIQKMQADLSTQYSYKKQPDIIGEINMKVYLETLPEEFKGEVKYVTSDKPGYEIEGKNIPLYSKDGTLIADGYDRIVIGHYGAFLEISPEKMHLDNLKCKPGEEYRINNPRYAERIKYAWLTAKDDSDIKVYDQKRGVTYADYRGGVYYVDPFEVCDEKEREQLNSLVNDQPEIEDDEHEL